MQLSKIEYLIYKVCRLSKEKETRGQELLIINNYEKKESPNIVRNNEIMTSYKDN